MNVSLKALFALTVLLASSYCFANWSEGDTRDLLAMEKNHQWEQAVKLADHFVSANHTQTALATHIEHLHETTRALSLAESYQQNNMPEQALKLLKDILKTLQSSATPLDAHLLIALNEHINILEAPQIKALSDEIKALLEKATTLRAKGNYVEAGKILDHILSTSAENLPPDLRNQAQRQKLDNQLQILAATNKHVQSQLEAVQALNKHSKYDDALTILNNILTIPANEVDSTLKNQAQSLKLQTELDKLRAGKPAFVQQLKNTLQEGSEKLLQMLIYIAAALAAFFLLRFVWNNLRPKSVAMEIALQDQTTVTGDPVTSNTALSHELDQTLRRLVKGDAETADLGGLMDLDASGLPSAPQPSGSFETFATHIDTTPVTIGPFSLSPRQLLLYLALLFRPRYESTLSGTLSRDGEDYVLNLKKLANRRRGIAEQLFEARAATRTLAVQQIATQLLVSLADTKITDDWRSLQAYIQAEREMAREIVTVAAQDRASDLSKAQAALQTALLIDPANWLARYRLATVLRKLGQNLAAKQQFDYVGWMLCSDEILQHRHLATYVKHSPLFPCLLIHNRAVCEAKIGSMDTKEGKLGATTSAIETFSYLVQTIKQLTSADNLRSACDDLIECGPKPDDSAVPGDVKKLIQQFLEKLYKEKTLVIPETSVIELLMLIRAARSAALGDWLEYEYNKYQFSASPDDDLINTIYQWINRNEDWFYVQRLALKTANWSTYALAHASAQNARGRASYLMRDWHSAQNFLQWAAGYHLPANFPEPYINLAALYLRRQAYLSKRWMELAEDNLNKALDLSPNSKKGRYLLGKLYYFRRLEDKQYEDKALEEFAKAGSDSWSLYRAADILVERNELSTAAQKLKLSIDLANTVDWRYRLYLTTIMKLARDNQATPNQIREARQAAMKLHKEGYRKRLREFGAETVRNLDKLIEQAGKQARPGA